LRLYTKVEEARDTAEAALADLRLLLAESNTRTETVTVELQARITELEEQLAEKLAEFEGARSTQSSLGAEEKEKNRVLVIKVGRCRLTL
jgi:hypothetical protein